MADEPMQTTEGICERRHSMLCRLLQCDNVGRSRLEEVDQSFPGRIRLIVPAVHVERCDGQGSGRHRGGFHSAFARRRSQSEAIPRPKEFSPRVVIYERGRKADRACESLT